MKATPQEIPVLVSAALIAVALALRSADGGSTAASLHGLLMIAAATVAGTPIARRAYLALRRRDLSIEVLVSIATIGALSIGELWEAAAVTLLFTLGHALEARTLRQTRGALAGLLSLLPSRVRILRDDAERSVAPHEVAVGDVVVVRPGERVPVDGLVLRGRSGVDESTLTGESMPVDKEPGSPVFTGTTAHGYLEVETRAVGADTTLAQIVRSVEEAQEAKPRKQLFLERFARYYTPAVVLASGLAWLLTADLHLALTLLVISCPGALVIAVPVANVTGIGRAARDGVLVKGGESLESLAGVKTIAFDKTGTLTRGRPVVREVVSADGGGSSEAELLALAASAESGSEHPIAVAIRAAAGPSGSRRAASFEALPGSGTRSLVEGHPVLVGSAGFLEGSGIAIGVGARYALDELRERGRTVAGVAVDGTFRGWIALADEVRDSAAEAIASLREAGVRKLVMLTGDGQASGEAVAGGLGLDAVHAELLPQAKAEMVGALASAGEVVAMVGDGVNDAPALARADVGIAMGAAGTRAALETATIALMGDDLRVLPQVIGLARRTAGVIRQNLAIALGTVVVLVAGVLAGEVHMAGGMLLHQASVLLVILNALRLARVGSSVANSRLGSPGHPRHVGTPRYTPGR